MGRPSIYTRKLGVKICDQMAEGKSLLEVCEGEGMPSRQTVNRWLLENRDQEFSTMYARARTAMADFYAAEVIRVANESTPATAHADRVKIDAYKWVCSRMAPEKYGDRAQVHHTGNLATERRLVDDAPEWIQEMVAEAERIAGPVIEHDPDDEEWLH